MSTGPLAGLKVLELGQFIAGPGTTMLLADLGAEVIKVEPLEGDASRTTRSGPGGDGIFMSYNRNKRSIALNLRSERSREVLRRLVQWADVFLQNARPGLLTDIGLGAEELRAEQPELIYVSISGFPPDGPSASRRGFDIAAQAESGMMSITGEQGGDPLKVGFAVIDAASNFAACSAILAAVISQRASGIGDTIDVSLFEVAVQLQSQIWTEYSLTGVEPSRIGNRQSNSAPAADVVSARDGQLVVSAYQQKHWALLCQEIGRPELADDPRFATNADRVANRPDMLAELNAALGTMTADEAWQRLHRAGLVVGKVRRYPEVVDSDDARLSGIFTTHRGPGGRDALGVNPPFRMGSVPRKRESMVPSVGEHSIEVLREIGMEEGDIASLLGEGDVAAPGEVVG